MKDTNGEEVKGGCGRAEVALVFVACQTIGPKSSFNKKNTLCRFQFIEALVTLAGLKYINTNVCKTFKEAVGKLLEEKVRGATRMGSTASQDKGLIVVQFLLQFSAILTES